MKLATDKNIVKQPATSTTVKNGKKAKAASVETKAGVEKSEEETAPAKPAAAVKRSTPKTEKQPKKGKTIAISTEKQEPEKKKQGAKNAANTEEVIEKLPKSKKAAASPTEPAQAAVKGNLAETKKAAKKTYTPKKEKTAKTTSKKTTAEATLLVVKEPAAAKTAFEKTALAPVKETPAKTDTASVAITFQIRYHTNYGQALFITGNHELLGNNNTAKALPMKYLNEEFWTVSIELDRKSLPAAGIVYNYFIRYEDGVVSYDWGKDKTITHEVFKTPETIILDAWNFAGYFENAFYTEPFKQVLLRQAFTSVIVPQPKNVTHILKVKAPLLQKGQTLALCGSVPELGSWDAAKAVLMTRKEGDDFFTASLDLTRATFPVIYKYVVYNMQEQKALRYEGGNNRSLYNAASPGRQTIVNDGFAVLPNNTWKGAGVAVPVFSLRSNKSAGTGEFADIKLLVDWAKKTGLKLVQILPVNDTTATHTWTDSYPYAAISAFALHPMYLRLEDLADEENSSLLAAIVQEKTELNSLATVDYEAVNTLKWKIIRQLYPLQKNTLFATEGYKQFFSQNHHWLVPYAAFCYLRDKYNSADFNTWPTYKNYVAVEIDALTNEASEAYYDIAIHFFVQYHLHLQLKDATQYAHQNGVIVKGDIPIGVYRYGADAWQHPALYHMDMQAGAPPDDFALTGQNWGFPTYNWEKMKEDGFAWWRHRLEQMSHYFDAFRIDHILGFFRIWGIPANQVEGIMGHFEPSIPVYKSEFGEKGIWFDYDRYCRPYITDKVLANLFGNQQDYVRHHFLNYDSLGNYQMKPDYATQRQLENYFSWQEENAHTRWLKQTLYNLISNVILFEVEGSRGQQFHFRFGMDGTSSFQSLEKNTQNQLQALYVNYYFRRQDGFWKDKAMETLPALKRATNMLVCGEDLGLVPACVPDVMKQLGLLSLEIQRMPKDSKKQFFHPADAPYLSVVTPSTHDMSTIRGWWEEDRAKTQKFYNNELGQWGTAPHFCEAWINKLIVVQHLHSPGMWSIFQLQDIMGIDKSVRRDDPNEERINVPAIPKYYWRYRMHVTLEQLLDADSLNNELLIFIETSGRA